MDEEPKPMMYVPFGQVNDSLIVLIARIWPFSWIVRTRVDGHGIMSAVKKQLQQETGLPVSESLSMEDVVSGSTRRQEFVMRLMSVFGSLALLLACVAIYGVMAYTVEQRRREIGIP